jgi:uracil-DNA glycosylase
MSSSHHVSSSRCDKENTMIDSLAARIPEAWKASLSAHSRAESFVELEHFLRSEVQNGAVVFPPTHQLFAALEHTALGDVRIVILGQDPYPTFGNANGLAFSVSPAMKIPASLKNIFAGLVLEGLSKFPESGDLTPWTRQGVLLLNAVLTVREGAPQSHRKKGWEEFTGAVLKLINDAPQPVVFLCLGKPAQALVQATITNSRHHILCAPHPSPLNGKAYVRTIETERLFSKANQLLEAAGRGMVDWRLP